MKKLLIFTLLSTNLFSMSLLIKNIQKTIPRSLTRFESSKCLPEEVRALARKYDNHLASLDETNLDVYKIIYADCQECNGKICAGCDKKALFAKLSFLKILNRKMNSKISNGRKLFAAKYGDKNLETFDIDTSLDEMMAHTGLIDIPILVKMPVDTLINEIRAKIK